MTCFWRKLHGASVLVGFLFLFGAAGSVDSGATVLSVLPRIIIGLALMGAFWIPAAYEEYREEN